MCIEMSLFLLVCIDVLFWTCCSREKATLESQVATITQRQKEFDMNEEHLNEKLKAITEKCQALLLHNSKLQEQVSFVVTCLSALVCLGGFPLRLH